ncbi:hypothetical protein KIN20_022213 [Parelaphostrongylus tenuis]|uniref:Uncharacterized protein n=1 Tax=Parelaphostrongylus tenuis TaxID=148309 RepID=A0AAD5N603_PARTN|nr:hypothetical protein KIN20_022213 [Parelaphostrongylus tenuis]
MAHDLREQAVSQRFEDLRQIMVQVARAAPSCHQPQEAVRSPGIIRTVVWYNKLAEDTVTRTKVQPVATWKCNEPLLRAKGAATRKFDACSTRDITDDRVISDTAYNDKIVVRVVSIQKKPYGGTDVVQRYMSSKGIAKMELRVAYQVDRRPTVKRRPPVAQLFPMGIVITSGSIQPTA